MNARRTTMDKTSFLPYPQLFVEYISCNTKNDMQVQHYHDCYEIYLQVSGARNLFHDDICYTLKPGDLVVFKPFALHYTESCENLPYERYVLNFSSDKLALLLDSTELSFLLEKLDSYVISLNKTQTEEILQSIKRIQAFSKKEGFLSEKLLYSAVLQLLMGILDYTKENTPIKNQNIPSEIIKALQYMNTHYRTTLTLDMVADYVHMSKYHFCRNFHLATGATFLEYLYNIRLAKAHQLLNETSLSLAEIAGKTGFSSSAHLSRVFRQVYTISPREFRRTK